MGKLLRIGRAHMRIYALMLVAVLVLSLCACGKAETGKNNGSNVGKETVQGNNGGNGSNGNGGGTQGGNNGSNATDNNGSGNATDNNGSGNNDNGSNGNSSTTQGNGNNGGNDATDSDGQGNNATDNDNGQENSTSNGNGATENSTGGGTSGNERRQVSLQVVVHSDKKADFIIDGACLQPESQERLEICFGTEEDGYFKVMRWTQDDGFIGKATNEAHTKYTNVGNYKYVYNGEQLVITVDMEYWDQDFCRFDKVEEYSVAYYYSLGGEMTFDTFNFAAADVVKDWDILIAGGDKNGENFPYKPEILYGIRDARFIMDVSWQTEPGNHRYQFIFDVNGETYGVELRFNRKAEGAEFDYDWFKVMNLEKTEIEYMGTYEKDKLARFTDPGGYDEEADKVYADIYGLINDRFLDIGQYTVRHIVYTGPGQAKIEEKTYAASEVARLNYTPASDFKYEDDGNGGIVLTEYNGNYDLELIIPREIDGKPVTAVGYIGDGVHERGFHGSTGILVPDSVKTLGDYCFDGARTADLILPEGLTAIGNGAFSLCNGITEITLPSTVTYIGSRAFYNCENLRRVVFPDGLETISEFMFEATPLREVILPKNLKTIERSAFAGRPLESITFPEGLESIGYMAFYNCTELKDFTLPDSLTDLGEEAFADCISITRAAYPKNMTVLNNAYVGCNGISSFTIPEWVTEIGDSAFRGWGLTSIRIPDGVTRIGNAAFAGTKLTSVTIPEGVTSIGSQAFGGCEMLTSVTLPESVTSIEWGTFEACRRLTSINIPDSVTSIGGGAFFRCFSLRTISLPSGVQLGTGVFEESPTTVTYR